MQVDFSRKYSETNPLKKLDWNVTAWRTHLIWTSPALLGGPLTLGARGKLPLLPPPVGGTACVACVLTLMYISKHTPTTNYHNHTRENQRQTKKVNLEAISYSIKRTVCHQFHVLWSTSFVRSTSVFPLTCNSHCWSNQLLLVGCYKLDVFHPS